MKLLFLLANIIIISNANAMNFKDDSVMKPEGLVNIYGVNSSLNNIKMPSISSSNIDEISWDKCPTGFSYEGSSVYPVQIRSITHYYINSEFVGSSNSNWSDLDNSCTKTEEKSIACPTGFSGEQFQRRVVATKDGNKFDYGSWNTYKNDCVIIPENNNSNYIVGYTNHVNNGKDCFDKKDVSSCIEVGVITIIWDDELVYYNFIPTSPKNIPKEIKVNNYCYQKKERDLSKPLVIETGFPIQIKTLFEYYNVSRLPC